MPTETTVFAIAPDRQTAAVAGRALARAGLARLDAAHDARGVAALLSRLRAAGDGPIVAVLASGFPGAAVAAVGEATSRGGLAVCSCELLSDGAEARDGWLLGQILSQRGCLPCPGLPAAVEAIRVHRFCGARGPWAIRREKRKAAVARRLEATADRLGLLAAPGDRRAALALEVEADGSVRLRRGVARLELDRPKETLDALALLAGRRGAATDEAEAPAVDAGVVDMIVRPPGRLLSELASKRLVAAFGIRPGAERLSTSPTETARLAAELEPPLVLKLVRPETAGKEALGAVRTGVRGASEMRRTHHDLLRLGSSLGPPSPLGVLVASEVAGGARLWIARERHEAFGLLVVGGAGDRPSPAPGFALAAPASAAEAERALSASARGATDAQLRALAEAVSRFSALVSGLGDRIDRAEIHPLVAPEAGPALALDALVGIAG